MLDLLRHKTASIAVENGRGASYPFYRRACFRRIGTQLWALYAPGVSGETDDDVRGSVLARVSGRRGRVLIGIDGVDGSGKTTFAKALAVEASRAGHAVVRIGLDNFLNPRAERYRLGRHSPMGFWLDTYNYARFRQWVLDPLSGDGLYREACYDIDTDQDVSPGLVSAPLDCLVIVDGMFLHRDALVGAWDFSVFLDVPFSETARRMALRDGSNVDPDHQSMRRYVQGQRIYFAECDPASRADIVMDNTMPAAPRIIGADEASYLR